MFFKKKEKYPCGGSLQLFYYTDKYETRLRKRNGLSEGMSSKAEFLLNIKLEMRKQDSVFIIAIRIEADMFI